MWDIFSWVQFLLEHLYFCMQRSLWPTTYRSFRPQRLVLHWWQNPGGCCRSYVFTIRFFESHAHLFAICVACFWRVKFTRCHEDLAGNAKWRLHFMGCCSSVKAIRCLWMPWGNVPTSFASKSIWNALILIILMFCRFLSRRVHSLRFPKNSSPDTTSSIISAVEMFNNCVTLTCSCRWHALVSILWSATGQHSMWQFAKSACERFRWVPFVSVSVLENLVDLLENMLSTNKSKCPVHGVWFGIGAKSVGCCRTYVFYHSILFFLHVVVVVDVVVVVCFWIWHCVVNWCDELFFDYILLFSFVSVFVSVQQCKRLCGIFRLDSRVCPWRRQNWSKREMVVSFWFVFWLCWVSFWSFCAMVHVYFSGGSVFASSVSISPITSLHTLSSSNSFSL